MTSITAELPERAEFFRQLHDHLETWGPNCGAPRAVYEGHLRKLLEAHAKMLREKMKQERRDG